MNSRYLLLLILALSLCACHPEADVIGYPVAADSNAKFADWMQREGLSDNYQTGVINWDYAADVARMIEEDIEGIPDGVDYWQTSSETLTRGAGDCDDRATVAFTLLLDAGFSTADIGLAYLRKLTADGWRWHLACYVLDDGQINIMHNGRLEPGLCGYELLAVYKVGI